MCAVCWASGSSKPPWCLVGVSEEVLGLVLKLKVSVSHVKRSTNEMADFLAKEGVWRLVSCACVPFIYFPLFLGGVGMLLLSICLLCCLAVNKIQLPFTKTEKEREISWTFYFQDSFTRIFIYSTFAVP